VLATAFCALSINVLAETYTVQVELNSTIGETPLTITESQAMNYPILEVNEATKEGATCVANGKVNETGLDGELANNINSLCPGDTATNTIALFTGVPNALISFERTINIQEKSGLRFSYFGGKALQVVGISQLSAERGTLVTNLGSTITLFDKNQVTDAVMEFTYDISAAYQ